MGEDMGVTMAARNEAAPVIIKRKKIIAGEGHHGGAWKVAYADFVTAMMAFFLLMWLLGATDEKQRKGVADYFSPTVSPSNMSGGSDVLGGDSFSPDQSAPHSGNEVAGAISSSDGPELSDRALEEIKDQIDTTLTSFSGESMVLEKAFRHVVTRLTDEGLVIELYDLEDVPLFVGETAEPRSVLREALRALSEVMNLSASGLSIKGHVRSYPVTLADNPVWRLSVSRAETVRALLQEYGTSPQRQRRLEGHADRRPVTVDPMLNRNNRIEIVLLRNSR